MGLGITLDRLHFQARQNVWLRYFAIFCRIALAAGFIPSGLQKILGERFTVLAVNHPMGNFFEPPDGEFFGSPLSYRLLLHLYRSDAGSGGYPPAHPQNGYNWSAYIFSDNSKYLHFISLGEI